MAAIDVYNSALDAIGTKSNFSSIADTSVEIASCNQWYDQVRKLVLCAAPWTSTTVISPLVVAVERDTAEDWVVTDPPPGYLFAYTVPGDMLHPLWMADYSHFSITQSSGNVKRINSNTEDAIFYYTRDQTDTAKWDASLSMAITFTLAAYITMKLTGKKWIKEDMVAQANGLIMSARLISANSIDNVLPDTVAPWHAARGVNAISEPRYIFPYGPSVNLAFF